MKNLVVIHGVNGGINETFGPYLEEEVKSRGINYYAPEFPVKKEATYEKWAEVLDGIFEQGLIDENTIIVAHSLGNIFIVRYLLSKKQSIGLYIGLAGFADYKSNERKDLEEIVNNFKIPVENIKNVIRLMPKRFSLYSDNDHILKQEDMEAFANLINSNKVFIPNIGHMGKKSGIKEIPQIIEIIDKYYEK